MATLPVFSTESFHDELLEYFTYFHKNPEASYQEFDTTAKIIEILNSWGIEVLDTGLETGVAALIRGGKPGSRVAIRADIDGLPILEDSGLDYASERTGFMHACGHDFHISWVLAAARLLHEHAAELAGDYVILFQPAEESSLGALKVLEAGVLDDVEAIIGAHVHAQTKLDAVGVKSGPTTAAVDRFVLKVTGDGSHGAYPHKGTDPLYATVNLVLALQQIRARQIDPQEDAVISVTQIHSGTTWNVLPDRGQIEGTVRTVTKATREFVKKRFEQIADGIAKAYNVTIELDWIAGPPATDNDPRLAAIASQVASEIGLEPTSFDGGLGGEDFAFYQERIPGFFTWAGVGTQGGPLHTPQFAGDPAAIEPTARFLASLAVTIATDGLGE